MARARISLPVPLSPVIKMFTLVPATRRAYDMSSLNCPSMTACSSSCGTSSIGHRVNRSSLSTFARSRLRMVPRRSVIAFSVAIDWISLQSRIRTSTERPRAAPRSKAWSKLWPLARSMSSNVASVSLEPSALLDDCCRRNNPAHILQYSNEAGAHKFRATGM